MKKCLKYLIPVLVMAAFMISGCGQGNDNKPKELFLCSSLGKAMTEDVAADYTAATKTKVHITYLPGGSFQERVDFLRRHKFDCWLGGTGEEYYMANKQNILQPYIAKESYKVPAELRSRRGEWTSLYLSYIALLSNKHNLRQYGLYAPETWDELLVSDLQDEIAIPNPALGGASYGMVTSLWQLRGKEQALDYAAKLNQQRPIYTGTPGEAVDLVYIGKKTVAVVPMGYALMLESRHRHLFATVPKDANRTMLTGAAIMKNANDEEQAQKFLDYLMSDESINSLTRKEYTYMWHVKYYPYNDGRRELIGNVKVPVDDLNWTASYKSEIIKQWLNVQ